MCFCVCKCNFCVVPDLWICFSTCSRVVIGQVSQCVTLNLIQIFNIHIFPSCRSSFCRCVYQEASLSGESHSRMNSGLICLTRVVGFWAWRTQDPTQINPSCEYVSSAHSVITVIVRQLQTFWFVFVLNHLSIKLLQLFQPKLLNITPFKLWITGHFRLLLVFINQF